MRKYKMMADGRWWESKAIREFRKYGYKSMVRSKWLQAGGFAIPVVVYDRFGKAHEN